MLLANMLPAPSSILHAYGLLLTDHLKTGKMPVLYCVKSLTQRVEKSVIRWNVWQATRLATNNYRTPLTNSSYSLKPTVYNLLNDPDY